MSIIIPKNTQIPNKVTKHYRNASDDQTHASIKVYEGENEKCEDNTFLDEFTINIRKGLKDKVKIEVTFELDKNSILNVYAKDDRNEEKINKLTIKRTKRNEEEIEKMIEDEKKMIEDDKTYNKKVEIRNKIENLVNKYNNKEFDENNDPNFKQLKEMKLWVKRNKENSLETYLKKLQDCQKLIGDIESNNFENS